jgi:hypothetical protein
MARSFGPVPDAFHRLFVGFQTDSRALPEPPGARFQER